MANNPLLPNGKAAFKIIKTHTGTPATVTGIADFNFSAKAQTGNITTINSKFSRQVAAGYSVDCSCSGYVQSGGADFIVGQSTHATANVMSGACKIVLQYEGETSAYEFDAYVKSLTLTYEANTLKISAEFCAWSEPVYTTQTATTTETLVTDAPLIPDYTSTVKIAVDHDATLTLAAIASLESWELSCSATTESFPVIDSAFIKQAAGSYSANFSCAGYVQNSGDDFIVADADNEDTVTVTGACTLELDYSTTGKYVMNAYATGLDVSIENQKANISGEFVLFDEPVYTAQS